MDLPDEWVAILRAIVGGRAAYARAARLGPPEALAACAAAGWVVRWDDPGGCLTDRWTLSAWAACWLGIELAEPLAGGREPRWYAARPRDNRDPAPFRAATLGARPLPTRVVLPRHQHETRFCDLSREELMQVERAAEQAHRERLEEEWRRKNGEDVLLGENGTPVELWGRKVVRAKRKGKGPKQVG